MVRAGESITGEHGSPASPHLVEAILVTIFCCQLTGIVAIVYAAIAMSNNSNGNYAQAHKSAKTAMTWAWVSFGLGLTFMLFYAGIAVIGAAAGATP